MFEGYQFGHIELWSNKGRSGDGPEPHAVRKNGQRKWTAQEILDEAERIASASAHVIQGRPGPQILPRAVASFRDIRKAQEEASQVQEPYIRRAKGRRPVPVKRKLRKDAATLYASVFSLPVLTEEALANPELKREALDVLEQALEWECERISKAGGVVLAGVVHWDEEHLHLHVFAVDPVRGRVDHLHPGRVAKEAVNQSGEKKSKDRGKRANVAYCDAMRAWQDKVYEEVFAGVGLMRFGPGRGRWTRKEYGRAKALQKDIATREARLADLDAWEGAQEVRQAELDAREKALEGSEAEKAQREGEVAEKARAAEAVRADAVALRTALDIGSRAVAYRELDYRQASEEREEGLEFGPGAPRSKKKRERLMHAVRPAYDFVVDLARKAFNIRRRETRLAKAEAQNRKAAMSIADERERAGQVVPKTLAQIINDEPLPLDRDAFPGALFLARSSDPVALQKELDEMPNVSVRRTWVATWQSMKICDERPDLAEDLGRGVAALELAAHQRGYDLESGKHHPEKAEDPKRARLHVDAEPDPIRIIRRNKHRVLTRG
ncbi:hypothetical protein [Pseudoponticoccus marisrubri]|uniref:Uncharacterized protein n=1 Tax=Pseudoponticoccus marisrubri TaxID=1685382 RepID=A0A0W7WEQ1_9RHOB|nr:hypothetical protein [Pseudoponticoccus marisrubri]KUF09045.1 hypothetical protein AVJ23_19820 [Pseudoponticoccus marisrubri]